jgi:cobalt-precorrin-5B (C1)-methyltransferase
MILVFGGTTEGRMVAQFLDIQQMEFYYSTKLGSQQDVPGRHIAGAMNAQQIVEFCTAYGIRLLVDAAHPFAVQLHENISQAAALLDLKVVRVERRSPEYTLANVRFFDSWQGMAEAALEAGVEPILALTGVQTIVPLKDLWSSRRCYFRILNTVQSKQLARASGISMDWIIQDSNPESEEEVLKLVQATGAQIILTKDSGYSGGLEVKIAVSMQLEVPLWVLKRPLLPAFDYEVYERKELLMLLLRLKKELLATEELKAGFTTGVCVCAAAKGSIIALEDGAFPSDVTVYLADGTPARFVIFPNTLEDEVASCSVIKDAGDDPDVTHAKEVGCTIYRRAEAW